MRAGPSILPPGQDFSNSAPSGRRPGIHNTPKDNGPATMAAGPCLSRDRRAVYFAGDWMANSVDLFAMYNTLFETIGVE